MICPYCAGMMKKGKLISEGRGLMRFNADNQRQDLFGAIAGKGIVRNVKMTNGRAELDAFYCERCKKLVADVNLA